MKKCLPNVKSLSDEVILHPVSAQFENITWTHYRKLLQVEDSAARDWYRKEAEEQVWSVRTSQRNISPQYYLQIHLACFTTIETERE